MSDPVTLTELCQRYLEIKRLAQGGHEQNPGEVILRWQEGKGWYSGDIYVNGHHEPMFEPTAEGAMAARSAELVDGLRKDAQRYRERALKSDQLADTMSLVFRSP